MAAWTEAYAEFLIGNSQLAHELFEGVDRAELGLMPAVYQLGAARAAASAGAFALSLDWYRRLGFVNQQLGPRERARAFLEAALVAMQVGPERYAEARAYALEAERDTDPLLVGIARATRVLAALRAGDNQLATELTKSIERPAVEWLLRLDGSGAGAQLLPRLPPGERVALVAALQTGNGDAAAAGTWKEYLEEAAPSWPVHLLEHARGAAGARP